MRTAAPKGGGATKNRTTEERSTLTTRAAATQSIPDLRILREQLVGARRRLVERLAEDFQPDRRFPDSGWTKMLADIEIAILAVTNVMSEGEP